MSLGAECQAHKLPAAICARCKGAAEERERIIKLLEDYDAYINRDLLIALIKGENK